MSLLTWGYIILAIAFISALAYMQIEYEEEHEEEYGKCALLQESPDLRMSSWLGPIKLVAAILAAIVVCRRFFVFIYELIFC